MNDLFLLAINLTRRCNLNCSHCYLDAETLQQGSEGELSTGEVTQLLDQIAARSTDTMVVLTGGEPLIRKDLEQLVRHGSQLGLSIVIGTNGVLLTEQRVQSLKAAGAMGAGISVDSLDPGFHDQFRGCPGSWEKTLAGMDACRKHELPFQVHFSITEGNAEELEGMVDFTKSVGAHLLNIFFLVCTGRGEKMSDITPQRYEAALNQIIAAQQKYPDLMIRARCAPHYKRIAYQNDPSSPVTRAEGYEGGAASLAPTIVASHQRAGSPPALIFLTKRAISASSHFWISGTTPPLLNSCAIPRWVENAVSANTRFSVVAAAPAPRHWARV